MSMLRAPAVRVVPNSARITQIGSGQSDCLPNSGPAKVLGRSVTANGYGRTAFTQIHFQIWRDFCLFAEPEPHAFKDRRFSARVQFRFSFSGHHPMKREGRGS